MAEVIFNYEEIETIIKCNIDSKMKDIINDYLKKIKRSQNDFYYIYKDNEVYEEFTFNEQANEFDKIRKRMNITVNKITENKEINEMLSKEIICPECQENTLLNIQDFNINLFGCKKTHKINNLTLYKFEESQKIDSSKFICSQCKTNNISIDSFFICFSCNITICSNCKLNHDSEHIIVNYRNRNYICENHNKIFKKYCKNCNENICVSCENNHINHDISDFGKILLNKNELLYSMKNLKKLIEKFRFKIDMIKSILEKMMNMLDKYYKINYDIYINYDMKKLNYYQLLNLNNINNNNKLLIKNLQKVIEEEKIYEFSMENFYNENGEQYVGEMKNNLKDGKGIIYFKNDNEEMKQRYEGQFKNNKIQGKGFMFWKLGNMYEGSFKNGKMEGKGIFYYSDGSQYLGEFKNGKRDGKGILYYATGNIYEGDWKNGTIEGKGKLYGYNDDRYIGEWKDGEYDGIGTYFFNSGNIYEGEWKKGQAKGRGIMIYKDGTKVKTLDGIKIEDIDDS